MLQDSVYHLIPQRKKYQFKVPGVKEGIPTMEMEHYQDLGLEFSPTGYPVRVLVSPHLVAAH
jgi:hypothetical protein